jgi:enoyl-CoA hydratase
VAPPPAIPSTDADTAGPAHQAVSIDYGTEGHVTTITINRPETRNALDMAHFQALAQAWARFRDDPEARVAVITGVDDVFFTGADLKKFIPELTGELPRPAGWDETDAIHAVLHDFPLFKPVIAAVNGICLGGGMVLLGCTDIRLASADARFAVMEPKRGLFAGGGPTVRFPRQMPWAHAMELLLAADMVSAERAMAMGLLNAVAPRTELLEAAYGYAHRIAANAPLAVAATKQSVVEGLALRLDEAFGNEARLDEMVAASEDAAEGARAWAENRPPVWRGR